MATCKLCRNITVSLLILLCFSIAPAFFVHAQGVRDTIKPGEVLEFSDQLTSADGRFILGFFNPLNAAHRYLGIWYKDDPDNVVWVAHPTIPLYGRSGNLTMDADGVLKIMQSEGSTIALNSNHAAENSTATLEDSGNFELTELYPDGSAKQVLWQSFDFPTNTLLPGMKLGVNFQTGQTWFLTSWLSQQIATPGTFTLEWSNSSGSGQLIAKRRGDIYWRSGSLNLSSGIFEDIRGSQGKFNFSYVSNQNESYFTYSVLDGSTSRLVLDEKGAISNLLTDGVCYGLSGCVMSEPTCRSRDDPYVPQIGVFDGSAYLSDDNVSIGLSDCWTRCWNECSCIGYNTLNTDGTGCQLWNTDVNFTTTETNGRMPYVLSSAVPPSPNNSSGNGKWWMWLIIAVAGVLVILSLGFLCYLRRKKLQRDKEWREEIILLELIANGTKESGNAGKKDPDLKVFTLASITAATNGFSTENTLGVGGFGPVYKGKLPDGQEIAVKRLSMSSAQGLEEFKNELLLMAKLQHINIVGLLGCCVEGEEKMLIFEFMPNKSLDFFLFEPMKRELLDWKRRYKIIDGIAQGLLYLHKYSRFKVIHRDLKPSNVLLDDDMNPKISDFSMARIFGRHESEANTDRIVGTYGYISPEYIREGRFSEKSDIYSFGVLLLEIVSGRKNSAIYDDPDCPMDLVGFIWQLWREGRIVELMDMDPTMADSCNRSQVLRCIHVGLLCVQDSAVDRPSMADVISMLFNETVPLPTPKQIAFYTQQKLSEQDSCSVSVSSISEMEGR